MIEFELWPEALKRAVATRDAAVKPLMSTIESLDVTWTVVQGNFGELLQTIDAFAGRDSASTIAVLKQSPPAKRRYHLEVVRRFHNFLSAAVAYLYHSERSLRKFKALVGEETYAEWQQRHDTIRDRLYFLEHLRDFSIHSGVHQSVLTLRFTEAGQPFGEVGFSVQPVLADLEAKNPRSTRDRRKLQASIGRLKTVTTPTIEIRPIANDYYEAADVHRIWFRRELVDLYSRLSNDLARWAPEAERAAIRQFFVDNPIPVFGEKA